MARRDLVALFAPKDKVVDMKGKDVYEAFAPWVVMNEIVGVPEHFLLVFWDLFSSSPCQINR
jgi:hypothetical protein